MESQVSPNTIQERAEKLAVDASAIEKASTDKAAADVAAKAEADKATTVTQDTTKKPDIKAEVKSESTIEKPIPNDPAELRKWNTKVSQENAAMRDEIKGLKAAVEKMMKKPVDYKELAKNPEALQKQIETERQEAIADMQDQLQEAINRAVTNETTVERLKREQDAATYPEWKRLFPMIQNLASNTDGRINFNKKPGDVLDDLYQLALQLSPVQAPAPAPTPTPAPTKTAEQIEAEIQARVAEAEKKAFEKAQESLRAERNGAGIGSAGKGGQRSSGVSKDALQNMPLGELKKLISQE